MDNNTVEISKTLKTSHLCNDILVSLRKITQAIDLHSRSLSRKYGLTGPQLIILQEISNNEQLSVTGLGRIVSLSQGTVTDILSRLEKKGFITKRRSKTDKRRSELFVTEKAVKLLEQTPPPLQETFLESFSTLEEWEQLMILSSLHRIVNMMSAKQIDASPILVSGPIIEIEKS